MRPALICEAGRFRSTNIKIFADFYIRRASPTSGVRIEALIVLAQHKRNERIGKVQTPVRRASSIVIELAYKFRCTDRKQKYVQYKTTTS